MKNTRVKLIWNKKQDKREDDILAVYKWPVIKEMLQLRRSSESKNTQKWWVRSCTMKDEEICEIFGSRWYYETLHGFTTITEFETWLEEKVYVDMSLERAL